MAQDDTHYDDYEWPERKIAATRQEVFGWNGDLYEMTLCDVNVALFNAALAPWVERARRVGLKVPPLPKNLRAEFFTGLDPDDPEIIEPAPVPPPATENPAPQAAKKKTAPQATSPLFATAEENEEPDRKTPVSKLPPKWWHTPEGAPYQMREVFKAARRQMWTNAGQEPHQGRIPDDIALAWAHKHPDRARKLAAMQTS